MKKFLLIFFLLLPFTAKADDFWVFIRTYNRYGVTAEDDIGRSKAGDIVNITRVVEGHLPTRKEQEEYAIVRVNKAPAGLPNYRNKWQEVIEYSEVGDPVYKSKAYRRYKLDLSQYPLNVGLGNPVVNYNTIKNYIKKKTQNDLDSYVWGQRLYAWTRPFRQLAAIWNRQNTAYAASDVSKICAIGDNCTDEDYNTLTAWEDAKDGDLVTATTTIVAECYDDDGVLDDRVTVDGSTTSADYYIKITAPVGERHDGTDTGFTISPSSDGSVITISDNFVIVEYMNITGFSGAYVNAIYGSTDIIGSHIRNNIIHDDEASWNYGSAIEVACSDGAGYKVYNNICYNLSESKWRGAISSYRTTGSPENYIYNNTVYDTSGYSFYAENGDETSIWTNNLGEGYFSVGTASTSSGQNISEDTTGSNMDWGGTWSAGTTTSTTSNKLVDSGATFITDGVLVGSWVKNTTDTSFAYVTAVDSEIQLSLSGDIMTSEEAYTIYKNMYRVPTFVNEAGDDFHLDSTDTAARGSGKNLSGIFTTDIDGDTRSAWDIGADEYVSAEPPAARRIMLIQ